MEKDSQASDFDFFQNYGRQNNLGTNDLPLPGANVIKLFTAVKYEFL